MLKKFIYSLCIAATVLGCSSLVTSCKDTDEELWNQQQSEIIKLNATLEELKKNLGDVGDGSLADRVKENEDLIKELQDILDEITGDQGSTTGKPEDEKKKAWTEKELRAMITQLVNQLTADLATKAQIDALQKQIDNIKQCSCDLSGFVTKEELNGYLKKEDFTADEILKLLGLEAQGQTLIELVSNGGSLNSLAAQKDNLLALADKAAAIKDLLGADLANRMGKAEGSIANLVTTTETLTNNLTKLTNTVNNLNTEIFGGNGKKGLVERTSTLESELGDLQNYFTKADGTKYTVEDFQDAIKNATWVGTNFAALQKLVNLGDTINGENLQALNNFLKENDFSQLVNMYTTLFPDGTEWPDSIKKDDNDYISVVKRLGDAESTIDTLTNHLGSAEKEIKKLFTDLGSLTKRVSDNEQSIKNLQTQIDGILGRLNEMVTGLVLQATKNRIFGSINTPVGVNTYILMTYYGRYTTPALQEFPCSREASVEYDGAVKEGERADIEWHGIPGVQIVPATDFVVDGKLVNVNDQKQADLGSLWFTVNPGTVNGLNVNNFALVNSIENESPVKLNKVEKDDDTVIKFGYSRAAGNGNGLYQAQASVAPAQLDEIKIDIEPGMKDALINAVNNRTAASASKLLAEIGRQVTDICDAQALRYTYTQKGETEATKIYSQYGIAATAFKPFGFMALYDKSFKTLPDWKDIEIPDSIVDFDFSKFEIDDDINLDLNMTLEIKGIEIDKVGDQWVEYKYPDKFNHEGNPTHWATDRINIKDNINSVIENVQNSVNEWINGTADQPGLSDQIISQINDQIEDAVHEMFFGTEDKPGIAQQIEDQVNNMTGQIQNKLYDLVDQINTDYIGKINRVGHYYQRVANRINNLLRNPNHYLQSMMMYRSADGNLARLSTNPKQATVFRGEGEAIELWPTSYCFETACPMFKKIVAVTKVTYYANANSKGVDKPNLVLAANNHDNLMGVAFNGERAQVALDIKGANEKGSYVYEIAYQGLDYTGHTSTIKNFITVVRK